MTIEARKAAADFRIVYANGGSFTLHTNAHSPAISGRGIRKNGSGYEVTSAALGKLRVSYHVEADF